MQMIVGEDYDDIGSPFPSPPFLARQHSLKGPLCIVSRISGINPPSYSVMFLEGNGGPALGDVWHNLTWEKLRGQFIPLRHSVTFKNTWPLP